MLFRSRPPPQRRRPRRRPAPQHLRRPRTRSPARPSAPSASSSTRPSSIDEAAYSQLIDRVDLALLACLAKTLVRPKELPFYEVLVFDAKTTACREALGGSPRAAIERALSRPHDYLACECCD